MTAPTDAEVRPVSPRTEAPTRAPGVLRRHSLLLWGITGWALLLLVWQLMTTVGPVDPTVSSNPVEVVKAGVSLFRAGTIAPALWSTAKLILVGMGLTVLIGVPLGVLFGASRILNRITGPVISIFYSVPFVLFLPLIIYWFGLGFTSKIILVIWAAILPLMINVMTGIRNLDRDYHRVSALFCCTRLRFMYSVAFPASLPYVLAGVRLALGRGLVGAVVAEFFLGGSGIGAFVQLQTSNFNMDNAMAAVTLLAALAVVLNRLVAVVESRFTHWSGAE